MFWYFDHRTSAGSFFASGILNTGLLEILLSIPSFIDSYMDVK